jgi:hypothetical protein
MTVTKTDYILNALGLEVSGKELTAEQIGELFKNFKQIKKTLEDYEKKTLKPYFFSGAESFGTQTDSGGHKVILEDGTGWEKQARVSISVNQDRALELLRAKGLVDFIDFKAYVAEEDMEQVVKILNGLERDELVTVDESVSNDSLEQVYLQGKISDDELGGLIERKVTYALVEVKPAKK